jgi:hypothetical protein
MTWEELVASNFAGMSHEDLEALAEDLAFDAYQQEG